VRGLAGRDLLRIFRPVFLEHRALLVRAGTTRAGTQLREQTRVVGCERRS